MLMMMMMVLMMTESRRTTRVEKAPYIFCNGALRVLSRRVATTQTWQVNRPAQHRRWSRNKGGVWCLWYLHFSGSVAILFHAFPHRAPQCRLEGLRARVVWFRWFSASLSATPFPFHHSSHPPFMLCILHYIYITYNLYRASACPTSRWWKRGGGRHRHIQICV